MLKICGIRLLWLALLILLPGQAWAQTAAADPQSTGYTVQRTEQPPTLDGRLDDAVWADAAFQDGFTVWKKGTAAEPGTTFAIACDGENLYLAIRAQHPDPQEIQAQPRTHEDGVWKDELIELFIDPDYSFDHYFHLVFNAAGSRYDSLRMQFGRQARVDVNPDWQVFTDRNEEGWTAEVVLPFASLMVQPDYEGPWLFNIARVYQPTEGRPQTSIWSVAEQITPDGFHDINHFRTLRGDLTPAYAAPAQAEAVQAKRQELGLNRTVLQESLALYAIHEPMVIANNLAVPNWFSLQALGQEITDRQGRFVLDLPEGVSLVAVGSAHLGGLTGGQPGWYEIETLGSVEHEGQSYQRYRILPVKLHPKGEHLGPIYLRSELPDGTATQLYHSTQWKDGATQPREVPLLVREFPTPGTPQHLDTSMTIQVSQILHWPQFMETYGQLGFSVVPTHGKWDRAAGMEETVAPLFEQARESGYRTMVVDSPFIFGGIEEARHVTLAGKPGEHPCPVYRGQYFQEDLDRLAGASRLLRPDLLVLDIEWISGAAGLNGQCQRCNAYVKQTGKEPREAMIQVGTEILQLTREAIKQALADTGAKVPATGAYHTKPGGFVYHDLFSYDAMHGHGVEFAMTVHYDGSPARNMGQKLREARAQLQDGYIISWNQPGFVTEYPPAWVYDRTLENFGSGVRGLFWHAFAPMEGDDYYHFAKAMAAVVPVELLLAEGQPVAVQTEPAMDSVSAIRHEQGYVLLLGDYDGDAPAQVTVTLPEATQGQVWDLGHQQAAGEVEGRTVRLRWQAGAPGTHTNLYYVGEQEFQETTP